MIRARGPEHPSQWVTCLVNMQAMQQVGRFPPWRVYRFFQNWAVSLRISSLYLCAFILPSIKCTSSVLTSTEICDTQHSWRKCQGSSKCFWVCPAVPIYLQLSLSKQPLFNLHQSVDWKWGAHQHLETHTNIHYWTHSVHNVGFTSSVDSLNKLNDEYTTVNHSTSDMTS